MTKTIAINGQTVTVLNTLSSGPDCAPHTFELAGGAYVYEIAGAWWLQERGHAKRQVEVAPRAEEIGEVTWGGYPLTWGDEG